MICVIFGRVFLTRCKDTILATQEQKYMNWFYFSIDHVVYLQCFKVACASKLFVNWSEEYSTY